MFEMSTTHEYLCVPAAEAGKGHVIALATHEGLGTLIVCLQTHDNASNHNNKADCVQGGN